MVYNNGSIKYIGDACFSGCRKLELIGRHKKDDYQLTIDLDLEIISPFTFAYTEINSFYLPDSVKIFKECCFRHNESLKKIHVPRELLFVEGHVFDECKNLRKIVFNKDLLLIEPNNFGGCDITIEVPKKAHVNIEKKNVRIIRYNDNRKIDDEDETKMEIIK